MKYLIGTVYAEADIKLVHNFRKSVIGLCVIGPCEDEQMLISVTSLNVFPLRGTQASYSQPRLFPLTVYLPSFLSFSGVSLGRGRRRRAPHAAGDRW